MKAWEHHKNLKNEAIPSPMELLNRIYTGTSNKRDRALIALVYLTGARISEIVPEKSLRKTYFVKNEQNKLKKNDNGRYMIEKIEMIPWGYPGIQRKDIQYGQLPDSRQILIVDIQNRKNKKKPRKTIPLLIEQEAQFIKVIEEYTKGIELDASLFPITKTRAWQIIQKAVGMNCHFLRNIRMTHLVVLYHRDSERLQRLAGWSDGRPASAYIQLRWQDIWT